MKLFPLAIGLGVALLLSGCGGGGGTPGPPVQPSTVSRANTIGDSWTYAVQTTLPLIGSGSGTYTQALYSGTFDGNSTIQETDTFDLPTYPNGPVILAASDEYSLNGTLVAVTSQGVLTAVKSNTFSFSGVYSSTTLVGGTLTLTDGTVVKENYQVTGTARVTVPAGTFDCWVVKEIESRNDGTQDRFTLYVDPALGNWVKADAQTLYSGGQEFDWHAQLQSMVTVPTSSARTVRPAGPRLFPVPMAK
jgi:hypothetical protein